MKKLLIMVEKGSAIMAGRKATEKTEIKTTEAAKVETAAPKAEGAVKAEAVAEPKAAEVKKTPGRKAAAKPAVKKTTVKRASKKSELSSVMHIQFAGKSYVQEDLVKIARDVWKYDLKQKVGDLASVELYVKPEEGMCYYVMNKEFTGSFAI